MLCAAIFMLLAMAVMLTELSRSWLNDSDAALSGVVTFMTYFMFAVLLRALLRCQL